MADERDSAEEQTAPAETSDETAPEAASEAAPAAASERPAAAPSRPAPQRRDSRAPRSRGGGGRPSSGPAPNRMYIKATFNNILISVTDQGGNVIAWSSGGSIGFTGTKKGTPFAAQLAAENVGRRALDAGIKRVDVYCKGPGSARETAIRTLQTVGIDVGEIRDVTPRPHNGCRPKKRRRM